MKKTILAFLSMTFLLSPAQAAQKENSVPLTAGIAQATTLDNEISGDNEKPKKKKAKKAKKSKKAKKASN